MSTTSKGNRGLVLGDILGGAVSIAAALDGILHALRDEIAMLVIPIILIISVTSKMTLDTTMLEYSCPYPSKVFRYGTDDQVCV